ncbi:exodeoxyribonuclease V subunit gamma [Marichromatium bheemlicum]|uniref:RecBCD enzyme subunit RecC n=1 Tax=Marichromatium bheemlicum TaxID=365339 RepID=A0ABX1I8E7_9GAMM|nr:exodeoxyribonuclease V subunit gamma [Marichromatium bheemlicum]
MTDSAHWPTGFMLIQGNRLESLRDLLTTWIARYPLHPLEDEVVLVQSNGIAQWIKLALAEPPTEAIGGGCGISAALRVMLPGRFVWEAYRGVLGELPTNSPYDKAPLTWRIHRLLGTLSQRPADPLLAPLQAFMHGEERDRRRHQLAERLADLFDQYQVYRADWLAAWGAGDDCLIRANGTRQRLPEDQRWQPLLWRLLHQDLAHSDHAGDPLAQASRAEIHRRFLATVEDTPAARLPRRVIVFGISSLPRQTLEVLEGIATHSQVMLFVHNPSRHYWGDIIEGRTLFSRAYGRSHARKVPENVDETALHLHGHPLLAAWGRQGRDYIRLLDEHDRREHYEGVFRAQSLDIDLFDPPEQHHLLAQLQDDILELRPLAERQQRAATIDPRDDHSLRFSIAHSAQREVEILHDQLLEAFITAEASGRPLAPREILVMVPDIDVYAPHITAVFGRIPRQDPRHLPFHIADQGERHRNPLLIGLATLLELPRARFTVTELLDLLDIAALRTRFGIGAEDLPRLRHWITGANVRWGLDGRQREHLGLPAAAERNTWRFGLRRLLLGFAAGPAAAWQGIEPHPEVAGLEAALLGPLITLLETLEHYWERLGDPRTPGAWVTTLEQLLDDCFTPCGENDEIALTRVRETLEQWEEDCRQARAEDEKLALEVMRETLLRGLDAPSLTQRFLGGAINFATLMPMRAIPFRQIWLLGMNDSDYPRNHRPPDFDLMADDYRPGDRSRREDDRYLFLEALLSARERLSISWIGRNIRDNTPKTPSVLVGQLREHLAAGWRCANPAGDGQTLLTALTTEHPLQPFSRAYFRPERDPRLFTYAREWRQIHEPTSPDGSARLPHWTPEGPLDLRRLAQFLRAPVDALFRQRLQIDRPRASERPADVETFALDGLLNWQLSDALIAELFDPADIEAELAPRLEAALERLQIRGDLPAGAQGELLAARIGARLVDLHERWRRLRRDHPHDLGYPPPLTLEQRTDSDVVLRLEDQLGAQLGAAHQDTRIQLRLSASSIVKDKRYRWHQIVEHWLHHLAVQLSGEPVATWVLTPAGRLQLRPLDPDQARGCLQRLLTAWWAGMRAPLPATLETGIAWLEQRDDTSVLETAFARARARSGYLGRCYPDAASLQQHAQFIDWAERLYAPLYTTIKDPDQATWDDC